MQLDSLVVLSIIVNTAVDGAIKLAFLRKIYQTQSISKKHMVSAYLIGIILITLINLLRQPVINAAISVVWFQLMSVFLFRQKLSRVWVVNLLYALSAVFSDILPVIILSIATQNTVETTLDSFTTMCIVNLINWILLVLIYRFLAYFFGKNTRTSIGVQHIIFLTFLTGFEVILTTIFINFTQHNSSGSFIVLMIFGFFSLNLYVIHISENSAKYWQTIKEKELLELQNRLHAEHYQELLSEQEHNKKILHDARNHLQSIRALFLAGEEDISKKYTCRLEEELNKLHTGFSCSNPILSAIVSSKIYQAEKVGVEVSIDMEDIDLAFLSDMDITTIFGNVLDNAIEACVKLILQPKIIWVKVRKYEGFIIICVKNPIENAMLEKNNAGFLLSTKSPNSGCGLSNIDAVVNKYNGVFTFEVTKKLFVTNISFPE